METKELTPYIITYKYSFEFNGRLLSFRKKELFDITDIPKHIPFVGHWNINRVQLSVQKAKELVKQEELNHVFNL